MEVGDPSSVGGNYGTVRFNDPSRIGQKMVTLNYSDITGTPFWDEHWKPAFLFIRNGPVVKLKNVKMNLYTSDVHYIDNDGKELVAATGSIQKLIFLNEKDTSKIASVFECFTDVTDKNTIAYYKILNNGKFRLLQVRKSYIRTGNYDALQGKSEARFFFKTTYAITDSLNTYPLKGLKQNNILPIIYPADSAEQWLKKSRNKLNSEKEVITFLNYVNNRQKQ
jgi:hypothetical protein